MNHDELLNAEFWVQAGDAHVSIDEEEFQKLKGDRAAQIKLLEEEVGLPIATILAHAESGGRIQCAASTKSGYRCKCFVKGYWLRLDEWATASAEGRFCFTHLQRTMNVEVAS